MEVLKWQIQHTQPKRWQRQGQQVLFLSWLCGRCASSYRWICHWRSRPPVPQFWRFSLATLRLRPAERIDRQPEVYSAIGAAAKFAESRLQANKVRTKRRDPFGEGPGTGHKARQEGGLIVSLPEARQIFTSGNSDHKERWIKEPGMRDTAHLPDHIKGKGAFFLQSGSTNQHTTGAEGDIIIYPWDPTSSQTTLASTGFIFS